MEVLILDVFPDDTILLTPTPEGAGQIDSVKVSLEQLGLKVVLMPPGVVASITVRRVSGPVKAKVIKK